VKVPRLFMCAVLFAAFSASLPAQHVKGGIKGDHWGGAKGSH